MEDNSFNRMIRTLSQIWVSSSSGLSQLFLDDVSCHSSSLLSDDGLLKNKAICEGTHKWFPSDNPDYPGFCLRTHLCHLSLRLRIVIKRLILLEDICWIEVILPWTDTSQNAQICISSLQRKKCAGTFRLHMARLVLTPIGSLPSLPFVSTELWIFNETLIPFYG